MSDPARALMQPLRARILEGLAEPGSAASVARKLGVVRQKVSYHLQKLEDDGLVELVEERRKGNCVERIVRATSRAYLVGAQALGRLAIDPDAALDKFSSTYLLSVAAQAVHDIASLRTHADAAGKKIATLTLQTDVRFANAASRKAFADELADTVAKIVAKYHDENAPGGRRFRMFVGAYPAPPQES